MVNGSLTFLSNKLAQAIQLLDKSSDYNKTTWSAGGQDDREPVHPWKPETTSSDINTELLYQS